MRVIKVLQAAAVLVPIHAGRMRLRQDVTIHRRNYWAAWVPRSVGARLIGEQTSLPGRSPAVSHAK
jgi:hypothetical protein